MPTCRATQGPHPPLRKAYRLMRRHFGHQHWWPGDTAFEVCVGAILTQNTQWSNVERVIRQLKAEGLLDPVRLLELSEAQLACRIRPAGYPNVKARRLRAFLGALVRGFRGNVSDLLSGSTPDVRTRLLQIHGIGPETADCLLLYAGRHLSFVVDAYTRRIFERHGWCRPGASYASLQDLCASVLTDRTPPQQLDYWQDYHAQLVAVGKHYCRPSEPHCKACPLRSLLPNEARPG